MQANDFEERISDVLFGENGHGLSIYCCVRIDGIIRLKRFNVNDGFRGEINSVIVEAIRSKYLNEDAVYDAVDNIEDAHSIFYLVEATEHYNPSDSYRQTILKKLFRKMTAPI